MTDHHQAVIDWARSTSREDLEHGYLRLAHRLEEAHQAIDLLDPTPPRINDNGADLTPAGRLAWHRDYPVPLPPAKSSERAHPEWPAKAGVDIGCDNRYRYCTICYEPPTDNPPSSVHDADSGVSYRPWSDGHAIGYAVTWPTGAVTYIYLNASTGSDDGKPCVFVYEGIHGDPAQDGAVHHYDLELEPTPVDGPEPGTEQETQIGVVSASTPNTIAGIRDGLAYAWCWDCRWRSEGYATIEAATVVARAHHCPEPDPSYCNADGGTGLGAGHQCRCVRERGHDGGIDPARPHGCECGALWA